MSVADANTPSGDSLEVARLKQKLRPGSRIPAWKKCALRRRLAELQKETES